MSACIVYPHDQGGSYSKKPMIEMTIPSSLDDSLAPKGHHVCLFFTQYTPYDLNWNDVSCRHIHGRELFT